MCNCTTVWHLWLIDTRLQHQIGNTEVSRLLTQDLRALSKTTASDSVTRFK